jgi:hypothetical protein
MLFICLLHLRKPFIMKNRLSSVIKCITGGESCTLFAIVVTVFSVVILWQVITAVHGYIMDFASLQQMTAWRP